MVAAAAAARAAGVRAMCGFNYRRVPAVALMRQLVAAGRIGAIRHVRAVYLQDWIVDPQFPLVWRLQQERAGSGRAGRHRRAHRRPDPVRHRPADHRGERADRDVRQGAAAAGGVERPGRRRRRRPAHRARSPSTTPRCSWPGSTAGRSPPTRRPASPPAARTGCGSRSTARSARWRSTWSGSTSWSSTTPPGPAPEQGFSRILVTEPDHPYLSAWWPPGHIIGYEHTFTHQVRDLIEAIATGTDPTPSFADALQVQLVLDAVGAQRRRAGAVDRGGRSTGHADSREEVVDGATDHPVHRPVGRPAVRGGVPARLRVGLRRPRDRLLGRPLRGRQGARRRVLRGPQARRRSPSTT